MDFLKFNFNWEAFEWSNALINAAREMAQRLGLAFDDNEVEKTILKDLTEEQIFIRAVAILTDEESGNEKQSVALYRSVFWIVRICNPDADWDTFAKEFYKYVKEINKPEQ